MGLDSAFHFPDKGIVMDVVAVKDMKSLEAFTVCMWMKTTRRKGVLFVYDTLYPYQEEWSLYFHEDVFGFTIGRYGIR